MAYWSLLDMILSISFSGGCDIEPEALKLFDPQTGETIDGEEWLKLGRPDNYKFDVWQAINDAQDFNFWDEEIEED